MGKFLSLSFLTSIRRKVESVSKVATFTKLTSSSRSPKGTSKAPTLIYEMDQTPSGDSLAPCSVVVPPERRFSRLLQASHRSEGEGSAWARVIFPGKYLWLINFYRPHML